MEFNEKLQELRKNKGLTQEELAQLLFVSRTAVSKWESGRGYPNIQSLKDIATLFSVTVDKLLSNDELLTLAETDNKKKTTRFLGWAFGILDVGMVLLLFLPLFGKELDGAYVGVSLLQLTGVQPYTKVLYYLIVTVTALFGVATLILSYLDNAVWERGKVILSLSLNAVGVLLFIITLQPYVASFVFIGLLVKIVARFCV